jgi:hypothetical protein
MEPKFARRPALAKLPAGHAIAPILNACLAVHGTRTHHGARACHETRARPGTRIRREAPRSPLDTCSRGTRSHRIPSARCTVSGIRTHLAPHGTLFRHGAGAPLGRRAAPLGRRAALRIRARREDKGFPRSSRDMR